MFRLAQQPALLVWMAVLLFIVTDSTSAHPLSVSYSKFSLARDGVEAVYRLPMDDMDLLLQLDQNLDDTVSVSELDDARAEIAAYMREHVELTADGDYLEGEIQESVVWTNNNDFPYLEVRVYYVPDQFLNSLDIRVEVLRDLYPGHRNLAEFEFGDMSEQFVFQFGNTWSGQVGVGSSWRSAREFALLGIEHIFTGYDHILFLLGLLLVGRGLRNLVAIVTSFTVAHSLTLALATLGILEPVPWMIEAAIALSIAYIGMENLVVKEVRHRWRITFIFGLVHGFGFAGVLQEMDLDRGGLLLSLFSFNIGVEIGQIIILALCWPLLVQLARSRYRLIIVRLISTVILIFGILWFLERVMI